MYGGEGIEGAGSVYLSIMSISSPLVATVSLAGKLFLVGSRGMEGRLRGVWRSDGGVGGSVFGEGGWGGERERERGEVGDGGDGR